MNYYSAIFINMTQLSKIIKLVLSEQIVKFSDNQKIAKQIYDAKGLFVDNEKAAVAAILKIKDANQFNLVQKELQKLTSGRGIGQYVTSFIGHLEDADTAGLVGVGTGEIEGYRTVPLLDKIITHLTKIKASPTTIKIFSNLKSKLVQQFAVNTWNMPETLHTVNTIGSIVSLVFGPIGLALSTAFSMYDAKQYYDEGKDFEGGLCLVLALVPGVGKLSKPFIKNLAFKLARKSGVLTKAEQFVVNSAVKNKAAIKNKIADMTAAGIKSGKINPIALKNVSWIKPIGNSTLKFIYGTTKQVVLPASVYTGIYAANIVPLTKVEIESLNKKYLAQFRSGVDVMIADRSRKKKKVGESAIRSNKKLNEAAGADLFATMGIASDSISILTKIFGGAFLAGIALWLKKRAAKRGARLAALEAVNNPKVAQQFGLDDAALAQIWRSKIIPETDRLLIKGTLDKLETGAVTSEEALALIKRLDPGSKVTLEDLQDISPLIAFKSPLVKITPEQLAGLSLNQKIAYQKNPKLTYSELRKF